MTDRNRNSQKDTDKENRRGKNLQKDTQYKKLPDDPSNNPEESISTRDDSANGKYSNRRSAAKKNLISMHPQL